MCYALACHICSYRLQAYSNLWRHLNGSSERAFDVAESRTQPSTPQDELVGMTFQRGSLEAHVRPTHASRKSFPLSTFRANFRPAISSCRCECETRADRTQSAHLWSSSLVHAALCFLHRLTMGAGWRPGSLDCSLPVSRGPRRSRPAEFVRIRVPCLSDHIQNTQISTHTGLRQPKAK